MANINKSKIGSQDPDIIMYQGADTPTEQQVTQGITKLNPWKQECWHVEYIDSTNGKHLVYNKDKNLMNCYVKHKIAKRNDSVYSIYPYLTSMYVYTVSGTVYKNNGILNTDIPIIKEIEDKVPTILVNTMERRSHPKYPRLVFCNRDFQDNEYTHKLFQAIREYFSARPLISGDNIDSLFGKADSFGDHWHLGEVQQLYGARDNWRLLIGDGNKVNNNLLKSSGVSMVQTFANTGFDDITFVFNKNAVIILDNAFSATKPSLWGTWNLKVEYANTEKPYPYIIMDEIENQTNVNDFQGFIPVSMIKTFRAAKISQEGLNNFFKNSILKWCKDLTGCFADKLRCWHDTVPSAYGCRPYEEHENNTILIGNHEYYHISQGCIVLNNNTFELVDSTFKTSIPIEGSLLETFMDSSIKYFHPIIDCRLIIDAWKWAKAFATYRTEEGVHPMVEIRLKNLGNCEEYRFDSNGNWDNKNNTKLFSEESVKYLVNNCLDLTQYNPQQRENDARTFFYNGIVRNESKIYGPEEWRSKLSEEDLQGARRKNISIYINNELVN